MPDLSTSPAQAQKSRRGLTRLKYALGYSLAGLRSAWQETAFRQEVVLAVLLLPLVPYLGSSWSEMVILAGSVALVLIVELINTSIESVIDRIGPEWHDLSRRAKDTGSAAVLLSLLLCACIWASALFQRLTS